MTSPIRALLSPTRPNDKVNGLDESFSPIKIPILTPIKDTDRVTHRKTPDVIIQHPHGLTAKHDARRSSINSQVQPKRRSMVNTPLVATTVPLLSSASKNTVYPMTSPRNHKSVNIDSIRRSKSTLDSKLNDLLNSKKSSGKENRSPFESSPLVNEQQMDSSIDVDNENNSSPIKRHRSATDNAEEESALKIAKVVTNANEGEEEYYAKSTSEHSIQVDEVFYKEDLVGKLTSAKSSPTAVKQSEKSPVVIDNDSDSDPEDYGRIENTISQTIMPNTSALTNKNFNQSISSDNNHTQVSKIIRQQTKDYITPQRYTEPIAKSPATNQQVRINEALVVDEVEDEVTYDKSDLKDVTSPLKNHKPTAPVNLATYNDFENVDGDEDIEVDRLENEPTINFLMSPNSKPVFSREQISKIQLEHDKKSHELMEQLTTKDERILTLSQELNKINNLLIKAESQVRELRDSKNKLANNEDILSIQLKHNERELASLTKNYKIKENYIEALRKKLSSQKIEAEEQIKELRSLLAERDTEIRDLKSQFNESNNLNIANSIKIEKLLKEKEESWEELESQKSRYAALNSSFEAREESLINKINDLTKKNTELVTANSENEALIKEFEAVANTKITELENTIADINKEKEEFSKKLAKSEEDEEEISRLKSECQDAQNLIKKLEIKTHHLERVNETMKSETDKLEAKNEKLESSEKEKDNIIAEDVSKLNELVEAVNKKDKEHKEEITALEAELKTLKETKAKLAEQADSYKQQVENTKIEADNEVKRLAQYLHHEYAEKHTKKLGDVKLHYEKEKESLIRERRYAEREVELLKRKLNNSLEEVRQLTDFIDVNKLQYQGSSMAGRSSPKRSNGSRSARY
ncbi:uncharacterized protein RJT20DRAFT_53304 [Scheffersomyces xylosifermentans]|uniref:uncharacterized protein n=1 Tax=Scheffersomyces xylosifermentans TaxID=1304137 RepID=UPI00315DCDFA